MNTEPLQATCTRGIILPALAIAAFVAAAPVEAQLIAQESRVSVVFVEPEKFADVKRDMLESEKDRIEILGEIQKHIRKTGEKYIPEDMQVQIRITDVDMAGDFEPWRGGSMNDVRIVKDLFPPRVTLEFVLTDMEGNVVKEGSRRLVDLAYLNNIIATKRDDELKHEKELLTRWILSEFRQFRRSSGDE